jgi:hypothetical protein
MNVVVFQQGEALPHKPLKVLAFFNYTFINKQAWLLLTYQMASRFVELDE